MIDIDKFADEVINEFCFMADEEEHKCLVSFILTLCEDEEDVDKNEKVLHYHMNKKRFFN